MVSAVPDDSAALADRLGRYLPADRDPVSVELADGLKGRAARRARARQQAERPPWWSGTGGWPIGVAG